METVTIGYCYGQINPRFVHSMDLVLLHGGKHLNKRMPVIKVGTTNIADGRNNIVRAFLEDSDADWLLMVDTDQTFDQHLVTRMVDSADRKLRPLLSALIMAQREPPHLPVTPACVEVDESAGYLRFIAPATIPRERYWACMPGTGCVLIHRDVLEAVRQEWEPKTAWPWFKYAEFHRPNADGSHVWDSMGEDYTFFLRAAALGFPAVIDTTIEVGHVKEVVLTSRHFWAQFPPQSRPRSTWTVIPTKNNLSQLRDLIGQLRQQGHGEGIIVVDNGMSRTGRNWLSSQKDLLSIEMPGAGIHHMWNAGVEMALANSPDGCDIALLNDDLRIGENFLPGLVSVLRARPDLMVVCPNYDGREADDLIEVDQICADTYDGTGGLAGFAMVVKGDLFTAGYRFPTDCMWWFGDNDLLRTVLVSGYKAAIVPDVTVEHLDGGGATGKWDRPEIQEQLALDRAAFVARWSA